MLCRHYPDLSVAQTVEVMDVPANTVKTLTRRGLRKLQDSGLLDETDPPDTAPRRSDATISDH